MIEEGDCDRDRTCDPTALHASTNNVHGPFSR